MKIILCLAAATPVASWGAAALVGLEPAQWIAPTTSALRALAADAMLFTAAAVIVGAPVIGVASCRDSDVLPPRGVFDTMRLVMLAVSTLTVVSAALTIAGSGLRLDALAFVWQSHATLAAVALALALFGAACGAAFRDPLDAAAVSIAAALVTAGGVLVAGARIADVPPGIVALALVASPLVAIASAAHVDIVRMEPLYQMSPLAHLSIQYPPWHAALAWHLTVATVCTAALAWTHRTWRTTLAI